MADKGKGVFFSSNPRFLSQAYARKKRKVSSKKKSPAKKKTVTREESSRPTGGSGSNVSATPPVLEDFIDKPAFNRFVSTFSVKPIISERFMQPKPLAMDGIMNLINNSPWFSLFKLQGPIHELEVRMFYTNATVMDGLAYRIES